MAGLASQRSLKTIVGLQARSDPTILYASDLVKDGYIGEVLTANLNTVAQAEVQRGPGRIRQGVRANGANTLTVAGGHAIVTSPSSATGCRRDRAVLRHGPVREVRVSPAGGR